MPFAGEFTLQMAFQEDVTVAGNPAQFQFAPGGTNFLNIYFDATPDADTVAGTGYDNGDLIWSGEVTADSSVFFVTDLVGPFGLLDQFGADNQGGILTLPGTGGGTTEAEADSWDTDFFGIAPLSIVLTLFNSSLITPFNQTNPSDLVVGQAPNYGVSGINGVGNGPGGTPADFHFQADANQSFTVTAVPEPASLALIGLGLVGLGFTGRRRRA